MATGDPEEDPGYHQATVGSCFWRLPVEYRVNWPVSSGFLFDEIIVSERDLRLSVRQQSHVRLLAGESQLAYEKLSAKKAFQDGATP